jgi:hypothetical protein
MGTHNWKAWNGMIQVRLSLWWWRCRVPGRQAVMCRGQMRIREELRPERERNAALLEDATAQMKVRGAPQGLDVLAVHTTQLH